MSLPVFGSWSYVAQWGLFALPSIVQPLIASQVPKDQSGYALGTLSTGVVAGTLMGLFDWGLIAENLGMRNVFLLGRLLSYFWFPLNLLGY